MNDNDHEFILSEGWGVPAPLDKYLASLSIRKTSNDPSIFNVVLNANFGSTTVKLQVGDTEMEAKCSLRQAEVRLYHTNCDIDFGLGFSQHRANSETNLTQSMTISTEVAIAVSAGTDINKADMDAFLKVAAKLDASKNNTAVIDHTRSINPFNHIEIDTVSITGQPFNKFLSGAEVVEYEGWSGSPRSFDRRVGVGATLLVREDWIDFSGCVIKKPGKFGNSVSNLFTSKKSKKSEQFMLLLAYLVRRTLQDPKESKYATLACSAFVLEPSQGKTHNVNFGNEQERVVLHPALISQFSRLPYGQHEGFVAAVIEADADITREFSTDGRMSPTTKFNAPRGTVFDALRLLEELQVWNQIAPNFRKPIREIFEEFTRYTLTDLANLGFLRLQVQKPSEFIKPFQTTPKEALLFAVMRTKWFPFATEFIEAKGIRVPSKAVGAAVSDELDANWKASSCQRNGQNIKKWVAVLNPLFASLTSENKDYYYLQSLLSPSEGKGSIPVFTFDLAVEVEFRKLKGISYFESTASFGTSYRSLKEWRIQHPSEYESVKAAAYDRYLLWMDSGGST